MGMMTIIPSSYALTPSSSHPGTEYNEQVSLQQDLLWNLGKNLSVGDSYTYKICDPEAVQTSAANYHYFVQGKENHNSSVCYMIKLDFVNLLNSDENHINSDVWVVQAAISDVITKRDVRYSVFHVDTQTFEVTSADTIHPDTKKYTDSLQKTLFYLFKYTVPEPKLLQIGQGWGEVTEALQPRGENPYMTVLDNNQEFSVTQNEIIRLIDKKSEPITRDIFDAFEVGYEIDILDPVIFDQKKNKLVTVNDEDKDNNNVTTSFLILPDLPFPLSAESYSPVHITQPQKQYEFELIAFMTNNKNIDFEIDSIFDELKDDVVLDLPIIEIGTIELTFPNDILEDTDVISEEDDVEIILDDVVDIIPEDNDIIISDDDAEIIPKDDVEISSEDNTPGNNDKVDHVNMVGLAVLLVVMIIVFVIFKKFKDGKIKMDSMKKKLKKTSTAKKSTIQFEEKLCIDIKTLTENH